MVDRKCSLAGGGKSSLTPASPLCTLGFSFCSVRHAACTVLHLSVLSSPNIWKTQGEVSRNGIAGVNEPDSPLNSCVALGIVLVFLHAFLPSYKLCFLPGTHICLVFSKPYLYFRIRSNVHSFIH